MNVEEKLDRSIDYLRNSGEFVRSTFTNTTEKTTEELGDLTSEHVDGIYAIENSPMIGKRLAQSDELS